MEIKIFYDEVKYRLRGSKKIRDLIIKVIRNEKKVPGDLNFILTDDKVILKINREFMKRDNFTDVIAFDYNKGNIINGEIYISVDTVRLNANNYKVSLLNEIYRVMIHGTLHLCGYNDKTKREKQIMREMEDHWLKEI